MPGMIAEVELYVWIVRYFSFVGGYDIMAKQTAYRKFSVTAPLPLCA